MELLHHNIVFWTWFRFLKTFPLSFKRHRRNRVKKTEAQHWGVQKTYTQINTCCLTLIIHWSTSWVSSEPLTIGLRPCPCNKWPSKRRMHSFSLISLGSHLRLLSDTTHRNSKSKAGVVSRSHQASVFTVHINGKQLKATDVSFHCHCFLKKQFHH